MLIVHVPVEPVYVELVRLVTKLFPQLLGHVSEPRMHGLFTKMLTLHELLHKPLEIVHLSVYVPAVLILFTVVVGELASPKVTNGLPLGLVTTVHVPVSPGAGLLAAITADVLLIVWFGPAIPVVTTVLVKTTSAETVAHPALVSVQRRVAGDEVTVTEEVGELMLEIFAPPPTTLHVPVAPDGAADAAMVNVLLLQLV